MARRKSRRKTSRRRSPKRTNVLNVAQSIILGNAVTEGFFNTNMFEFVTGRIGGAYTPGSIAQGSQITLPELLGAGMGTTGRNPLAHSSAPMQTSGYGGVVGMSFTQQVQENLKTNGVGMMTTLIVTPVAFKIISNLAKKPRAEFNKLARNVGLPISM